ncbi:hypothetical protein V8G57_25260 [Collimonas sp. H4R21]|uniref:Uncharacterized protein n=1 Tax=Collimonas rhizosphaerae TaxID=3126357 RepID=A0ABU9Q378_9BURK
MKRTLSLGASSLTGKSANQLAEKIFGKSDFPLKLRVTNKTPRALVLPDVRLELKPNFKSPENIVEVVFKDHGFFTRFVSDIDSLSENNKWIDAIELEDVDSQGEDMEPVVIEKKQRAVKAGVEPKSVMISEAAAGDTAIVDKK